LEEVKHNEQNENSKEKGVGCWRKRPAWGCRNGEVSFRGLGGYLPSAGENPSCPAGEMSSFYPSTCVTKKQRGLRSNRD
jgi:hypothetical protein